MTTPAPLAVEIEMRLVATNRIRRNPNVDPRKNRNHAKYAAFVTSVRLRGVQQPIIIRPVQGDPDADFEVVAGNTRWSAAIDTQLEMIPAIIRDISDEEARVTAAIENIQRADLSPLEEANHAKIMLTDMGNDHAEVCRALGWSRTKLDARILLTHCCEEVGNALVQGDIKFGHAELLAGIDPDAQKVILAKIVAEKISVTDAKTRLFAISRDLVSARFDTAGCTDCPKNSATYADLFESSLSGRMCQDASCWNAKSAQLIEVKLVEAKEEFGVVHTDITLPKDGYVVIQPRGAEGIGEAQQAACLSCSSYGAVVSTSAGNEGQVRGGYCFDKACNSVKRAEYQSLILAASGVEVAADEIDAAGQTHTGTQQAKTPPAKTKAPVSGTNAAQPTGPKAIKKSIRRQAFTQYSRMAATAVANDRRLALAICIVGFCIEMRKDLPSTAGSTTESVVGSGYLSPADRAKKEVELAQRSEEELLVLLTQMAAQTVNRSDATDSFNTSLSGSQSLAYIQHANLDPTDFFEMSEDYLKSLVKAGIVEDCNQSGFAAKYDEVHGEKAFATLAAGKSSDLVKAVLKFDAFSWKGYLPKAFETSAQGGSGTNASA